ncbi:pirin family protein [Azoarcus sp. TTM-91]|uniref:pirin family protein n=1 Tax=Azoarcus sp. TTM-91 TaxID=2691581 RepID=UPI00145E3227|nr:pirin family protein [Azoarcus sp. TTM-91]NMG34235.1 pirin family protein [Azoarcus sp. TTM-91]
MITTRLAQDRGHANFGWLDSHHTFSFGSYYDPRHMGVSALRVINDDRVVAGAGFDTHSHRNMEIISYVLEGTIEHKDSTGSHSQLKAGEVQVMSAGRGIAHSEYNPSAKDGLHFLQIWIEPAVDGIAPGYVQHDFSGLRGKNLIVSPDGREGSLRIHQDASVYQLKLAAGEEASHETTAGRGYYVHVAQGSLRVNEVLLNTGDGAEIAGEALIRLLAESETEALLFELP